MKNTAKFLGLVGAMTIGLAASAHATETTKTETKTETKVSSEEKCYGVAAAGKNDCKGGGNVTCAGHAKAGQGFVLLPAGTCAKINGGSTTEPTSKKM